EVSGVLDPEDETDGTRPLEALRDGDVAAPHNGEEMLRRLRLRQPLQHAAGDLAGPGRGERGELAGAHARIVEDVLERKAGRRGLENRLLPLEEKVGSFLDRAPDFAAERVGRRLDHGHGQACYNRRG